MEISLLQGKAGTSEEVGVLFLFPLSFYFFLFIVFSDFLKRAFGFAQEIAQEIAKLQEGAMAVVRARYLLNKMKDAATSIKESYQPRVSETNFDAIFTQLIQSASEYDASKDELIKQFERQQGQTQQVEERIDDDIAIENTGPELAKNVKCPITMKELLDLDDPVVDNVGFVYERAAILSMLRNTRTSSMKCPVAGTIHTITEKELRPATAVLMEKRRVARSGKRRSQVDEGYGGEDVVVD